MTDANNSFERTQDERTPLLGDRGNMTMRVTDSRAYLNGEEGGCWTRKSGLEQKLVLLSGFLAIVTVALIITVAVIVNKDNSSDSTTTSIQPTTPTTVKPPTIPPTVGPTDAPIAVCETPECQAAGIFYSSNMKQSADPCNNFYDFVCGNWSENVEIPPEKGRFGIFDVLRDDLAQTCIKELENKAQTTDYSAVDNAKLLYQSCVKTEEVTEANGLDQIKEIKNIVFGPDENVTWIEMIPNTIKNFGSSYIISFGIGADVKDTTKNIIYLDQTGLGLSRDVLLNGTIDENAKNMIEAYKTYVKAIHCLILQSENKPCDVAKEDTWVLEYLDFEIEMTSYTRSPIERRQASSWYFPMTIAELQKNITTIDWLELITTSLGNSDVIVDETTIVIVKEAKYFTEIIEYINSEEIVSSTARDYILIRTLMSRGPYLFPKFRQLQFEFQKVVNGIQKQKSIEMRCFDLTNDNFGHAVGKLYVEAASFNQHAKEDMENMISNLDKSFEKLVENNLWMDDATKVEANKKLTDMGKMIGYPEWTLDDTELNKFYQMDKLTENEFFDNMLKTSLAGVTKSLNELDIVNDRTTDWVSPASIVNAFYSPSANSITFPAGILQNPFYVHNRTKAMNYGAIGYVIGHEITHGFDDQGRQYSGNGSLIDWWSPETLTKFNERRDCFIDQYSKIYDEDAKMHLNGAKTIGENIADNGGIREAYHAYILSGEERETLPGLEKYDDKQLFFIAAGSVWCTKFRDAELQQQILNGVHSPGKYRAYVPLSNSEEFAQAFNCEKGSVMNPAKEDQCVIW